MNFNDRNQIFRKSDPTYRNKKSKEVSCLNDMDSIPNIKRKGASLARPDFNRQNSFTNNNTKESASKRISVETSKHDSHGGGTKLMNFIKSSLNLSKSRSKSKLNLTENRQSLCSQTPSSKSEENLNASLNDVYHHAIKSRNLVLKPDDNTLYIKEYNSNNEEVLKLVIVLNPHCLVQPLHPSIVNYENHCFQILKREPSVDMEKQNFGGEITLKNNLPISHISKSYSYNSSFCSIKSGPIESDVLSTIYCGSASETNEWITKLKKHINPGYEKMIRHEDFFKVWIQEAKNLIIKKRYYCEIRLDKVLYGRTSIKTMTDMVFWGEEFEFRGLRDINTISLSLYRLLDAKKKNEKSELVAQINVPCSDFTEKTFVEKWYSPSNDQMLPNSNLDFTSSSKLINGPRPAYDELMKNVINCYPMLRIKGRYRPLEILPIPFYESLLNFLVKNSIPLVESLESHLKVKGKEDFVKTLLIILEHKESHLDFLSDLIILEVTKAEDNLIMRGNSIASKAIECYMKMIGEKYLSSLLTELINVVICEEIDCEVDPLKLNSSKELQSITEKQNKLEKLVENVWNKIYNSSNAVPKDLKSIFSKIREKLTESKRVPSSSSPMIDQVISSCLFLRFICPAIMSPFLFGLANEYSDKACINRTFTLVAKSIQSLANFSQFPQSKESYMGFMQRFINKNSTNMRIFLKNISSTKSNGKQIQESNGVSTPLFPLESLKLQNGESKYIDVGYHLAEISFQLNMYLKDVPEKKYTEILKDLRSLLESISKDPKVYRQSEIESVSKKSFINGDCSHSRIPTLITKPDKITTETKYKSQLSNNSVTRNKSLESNRRFSLPKKKVDVEENFSYIPTRNMQNKTATSDKRNHSSTANYVDFEHCESVHYDEPYLNGFHSLKTEVGTKCLNEEEINQDWHKMVKECRNVSTNSSVQLSEDPNNYTFNSSGYQSLSNFSPHDLENYVTQPQSRYECINTVSHEEQLFCSLPVKVSSPKTIPLCPRNIVNRLKKNSPSNNRKSHDGKSLEQNNKSYPMRNSCAFNLNQEIVDSFENLNENSNRGLSGSKSMLSLYPKKSSESHSNLTCINLDKPVLEPNYSSDCFLSSKTRISSSSLQSFPISLSKNNDLDPFISNEWTRIKLFLELFNIPKPYFSHGTAIEQYKQRTIDENCLLTFIDKKSQICQLDIINYLPAAYRLLQNVHKQGKIPIDILTNHLLNANQLIQTMYINQNISGQKNEMMTEFHSNKISSKSKNSKAQREFSNLSTHSLPFPLTKYSKQSQLIESINKL